MKNYKIVKQLFPFCLAVIVLSGHGCGKKGPPYLPLRKGQPVLEYFRVSPARGGVLVSWKEIDELPPPPKGGKWYGYRISKRAAGGEPDIIRTVARSGKKGFRYEYLDLDLDPEREYGYSLTLFSEDRSIGYLLSEVSMRPDGGLPPQGLKAVEGDGRVSLSWEPPGSEKHAGQNLLGYNIFRREIKADYNLAAPLNPKIIEENQFVDLTAKNENEYCYAITAALTDVNGYLESPLSEEVCAVPKDTTPPAAPTDVDYSQKNGIVILSWRENAESDLGGYRVYRRYGKEDRFVLLTETIIEKPTFEDVSVEAGGRYFYAVTAVDASPAANESAYSDILELTVSNGD